MKILKNISIAAFTISFAALALSFCVTVAKAGAFFFQSDLPWYVKMLVASLISCCIFVNVWEATSDEPTVDADIETGKFNINKYEQR